MTDAVDEVLAGVPNALLIGGEWAEADGGERFEVLDPATDEVLAGVADANAVDATRALDAADAVRPDWARTSPRSRAELLRRAFDLLMEQREDFALLMTLEMGKPLAEARGEVAYGAEFLRWFGEEAVRIAGRFGPNPEGTGTTIVSHRPVGPSYLVTPWNFPLAMATRKVAPALAAGATVVLKPAEATPLTTLRFGRLLVEAGLPPGVVNIVTTTRPAEVSDVLLDDPRLRKLSFTGSTAVGRHLLARAAPRVLRTSMELGGNAPFLVFEDADLDTAVDAAMVAKFRNIGQACTAANRLVVHRSVADELARRLTERIAGLRVGPGTDPDVTIGPLIDRRAVQHAVDLVDDAVARGGRILTGGHALTGPGSFFAPTLVGDVPADARLLREEVFGPLVGIVTFDDEEEAVAVANATEYGLVAYAHTRDLGRVHRLMRDLEVGMLGVNAGVVSNAAAPFGGVKQSGLGREGGTEGIGEYLEAVYTFVPA